VRSNSQDGPTTDRSGQVAARANPSPLQERAQGQTTLDIFGPTCGGCSESADLQRSLENRLLQRMDANGSPEYSLTWKNWAIDGQEPICALRGSGRRTSDNGCGGSASDWPTPTASMDGGPNNRYQRPESEEGQKAGRQLQVECQKAGWPTPNTANADRGGFATEEGLRERMESGRQKNLQEVVGIAGWQTPNAMDGGQTSRGGDRKGEALLGGQVQTTGAIPGSDAATEPRGVLNPAFPLWLMGYPEAWQTCAPGYQDWQTIQQGLSEEPDGSAREPCEEPGTR